ncbi:MAG: glycoside hydrolase family 27 protein, partial [Clostridia bacterium]
MKRNGMCPFCYIKQFFCRSKNITDINNIPQYDSGTAKTPPMGWSSWNTFRNRINQDLLLETATAMKDKGLLDAGYQYLNIDDNWHSSLRDINGNLQGDLTNFSSGIGELIKKVNALGLKVGLYTSNGTKTCEDLPASLGCEMVDAMQLARWGVEYFKYDFCHNVPYSKYAPLVYGIEIAPLGTNKTTQYLCSLATLYGTAKRMSAKSAVPDGFIVTGLDANGGAMEYNNIIVDNDGEYVLTVLVQKHGIKYEKYLSALINKTSQYGFIIPPQMPYNATARFQVVCKLKKGANTIRLYNPIGSPADSAMLQYRLMASCLKKAAEVVATETAKPIKPIAFSICEWGKNKPYLWGASAGNLWRTTPDIRPIWTWIMIIYSHNVDLYKYSSIGAYNDPDMLEVGNGNLTYDENIAHFSLWCMMNSPLILGNDVRKMPDNIKEIVTNKTMIAINQDALCKAGKRVSKGLVDIIAKPLSNGEVAICFLNTSQINQSVNFDLSKLVADEYISLKKAPTYSILNVWENTTSTANKIKIDQLKPHSVCIVKLQQ